MNSIGIILAAGRGTRMGLKNKNKTTLKLNGSSLIRKGLKLMSSICDETCIVVGAYADSVKTELEQFKKPFFYALQKEQKGTGHATLEAIKEIDKLEKNPENIIVGNGDHLYKYSKSTLKEIKKSHEDNNNDITLVSVIIEHANNLGWGRIKRNQNGNVIGIVEQKNANESEKLIKEANAGLYIIKYNVARKLIPLIEPNKVNQEIYITDIIGLAVSEKLRINTVSVPFEVVGYGINTPEHLAMESESIQV